MSVLGMKDGFGGDGKVDWTDDKEDENYASSDIGVVVMLVLSLP